ncbi:GNAT family N-acetyltransferase [Janthinobacterium sp. HLX7-2]|uniref:GNAT family N-acetyltransferase n=1 Tax=Janthinobacterium sp. HLX7-2 TaxID=1259331 RepID=UPI003F1F9EDC
MTTLPIITLRPALVADAPALVALIDDLMPFLTLCPDGAGAEKFIEHCRQPAIEGYLSLPNYAYQLAHVDGALAGVVAMRDNTHLFHMFVPRALYRRAMARRLWQAARDAALARGNTTGFTVNSSVYALPLYASLGFTPTGPRVEEGGIAFVPMRRELNN